MINLNRALAHLQKDTKFRAHIKRLPRPTFDRRGADNKKTEPFRALAESIVYQQLSGKAAATIFKRVTVLFSDSVLTPKKLLLLKDSQLRAAGLSMQKLSYLQDLARKFEDGTINPKKFATQSDEEIREHLIAVKGIGRWTADMFLMFYLHRPDVFPTGDLGIQKGFQKLHNMKRLPKVLHMERLAKPWSPWRSVAARYLWLIQDTPVPSKGKSKKK